MRWCVIRHPETGGLGVIPGSALRIHLDHGWVRVSEWATDQTILRAADFADAEPLDDPLPEPEPADLAEQSPEEDQQ